MALTVGCLFFPPVTFGCGPRRENVSEHGVLFRNEGHHGDGYQGCCRCHRKFKRRNRRKREKCETSGESAVRDTRERRVVVAARRLRSLPAPETLCWRRVDGRSKITMEGDDDTQNKHGGRSSRYSELKMFFCCFKIK